MNIENLNWHSALSRIPAAGHVLFYKLGAPQILLAGLLGTLVSLQQLLMQVGPILSAVLFIIAGVMYSLGQLMPPDKKAQFHSTSINIIMGAIIVAVLSVASNSLAMASTHLLSNLTISNATT